MSVVRWFVAAPPSMTAVAVLTAHADPFLSTVFGVAAVGIWLQALIYGPRALRAAREVRRQRSRGSES